MSELAKLFLMLGKKHSMAIIEVLLQYPTIRFNELQEITNLNLKTLSTRLKELEKMKLINRVYYRGIPPRVEYSLSEKGKNLELLFSQVSTLFQIKPVDNIISN
jgi:DNA-binding HxlR family transcriptional regulator